MGIFKTSEDQTVITAAMPVALVRDTVAKLPQTYHKDRRGKPNAKLGPWRYLMANVIRVSDSDWFVRHIFVLREDFATPLMAMWAPRGSTLLTARGTPKHYAKLSTLYGDLREIAGERSTVNLAICDGVDPQWDRFGGITWFNDDGAQA